MGMDLHGKGGYFRWNCFGWSAVLELAYDHGWVPEGTKRDLELDAQLYRNPIRTDEEARKAAERDAPKWDGHYHSNSHQVVTASDAAHIADALERALPGLPKQRDPVGSGAETVVFVADDRAYLEEFITFCRAGAFYIH